MSDRSGTAPAGMSRPSIGRRIFGASEIGILIVLVALIALVSLVQPNFASVASLSNFCLLYTSPSPRDS